MDGKGKRFADENSKITRISFEQSKENPEPKRDNQDKRLKEKNAKELEKLLKKNKRNVIRAQHKELTDEDTPSEQPKVEKRAAKKTNYNKFIVTAIIMVLLFAVVFSVLNLDKLTLNNISNFIQYGVLNQQGDERFPLDVTGESISAGNFIRMGQDVCYSSDTKTQRLNNYGMPLFTAQHAFINPTLTVGDKGALVYNLGGTGYQLVYNDGTVYSGEAENNILVADFADNGVYAIVTQSSGYLSKLYVYDEKNEQIFAYSFADYYVTSVSLNSSGERVAVSGVSALDGVNIASMYILDFTKDAPLYFSELENNIIYEVKYLGDKYACAIGRSASYVMNTYNGEIVNNDYEGRALTAYHINSDTNTYTLSLSNSGDGRNCDIISYSANGSEDKAFSVDEKIISLSTYKSRVALLSGDCVLLYSKDGRFVSEKELNSDPHAVVLYTTSNAYVLCTGYIDSVSL